MIIWRVFTKCGSLLDSFEEMRARNDP
jgi:hypothetical protein